MLLSLKVNPVLSFVKILDRKGCCISNDDFSVFSKNRIIVHENSQNFSSAWYLTYAEYLLTDIDLNIYTISSYLAWVERGMGALYTWSIGNCATWCNIPASLSCRLLVAFTPLNIVLYMPVISLFNFFIY